MNKKKIMAILFAGNLLLSCSENNVREKNEAAINMTTTGSTTSATTNGSTTGNMGRGEMNSFTEIMDNNLEEIKQIKLAGDPDYDFATMMSVHHKGSLEMADMEISKGQNKDLVKLAKKIRQQQEKELKELQKFTSENKPGTTDKACMEEMTKCKEKCQSQMGKMTTTGNVDQDFAIIMTKHHQHGLSLAKIEDKCGKDDKMKSLAKKITRNQEKEIKELEPYSKNDQ